MDVIDYGDSVYTLFASTILVTLISLAIVAGVQQRSWKTLNVAVVLNRDDLFS